MNFSQCTNITDLFSPKKISKFISHLKQNELKHDASKSKVGMEGHDPVWGHDAWYPFDDAQPHGRPHPPAVSCDLCLQLQLSAACPGIFPPSPFDLTVNGSPIFNLLLFSYRTASFRGHIAPQDLNCLLSDYLLFVNHKRCRQRVFTDCCC
jgi:hypothetical protein